MRDFSKTRFDDDRDIGDIGHLPNLMDLMLVFAVGLIAALASSGAQTVVIQNVEEGPELAEMPATADANGDGLEAVGQVYRDPETGKLFIIN
ncbi:MAG: hypothetical protein AAGI28_09215 [Pseudomonadota bacterium]